MELTDPNTTKQYYIGSLIKLSRFSTITWILNYGWFSYGGNRPICGWYLTNVDNLEQIKPFQLNDFDDIYLVEEVREDYLTDD